MVCIYLQIIIEFHAIYYLPIICNVIALWSGGLLYEVKCLLIKNVLLKDL